MTPVATSPVPTVEQPSFSCAVKKARLPVTLLSGFLGAGKTTLMEHILTSNEHRLRVGVIVNDVGELNIDAALLANHEVTRKEEQVIAMQNGCICCTLRGDLLEEVVRLAQDGTVDYLLIESSGVSEPMQVAETFSEEFAEMHIAAADEVKHSEDGDAATNARLAAILAAGGLSTIARLDTCVTVVDAVNFMQDFATADFLLDRHRKEDVPEEDDRNISDLQTDQVEFADVIIVNKCDLVGCEEVLRIKALLKTLNPSAKILTTSKSRVPIDEIVGTGLFSFEKAAMGAGWLKSLQEEVAPETEEYGIGTFVYRARRPFQPAKLWKMIRQVFVVIQEEYIDDGESGGEGPMEEDADDANSDDTAKAMDVDDAELQLNPQARLASKMADPTFAPLFRSKGFFWLATRSDMFGEWSQAGVMLTLSGGDKWRCNVPRDEWPQDAAIQRMIEADHQGEWGDRRQEIVFIGQQMKSGGEDRIRAAMDSCLLDDDEFDQWEQAMRSDDPTEALLELFEDGFEDWKVIQDDHDTDPADHHHHHHHHHRTH